MSQVWWYTTPENISSTDLRQVLSDEPGAWQPVKCLIDGHVEAVEAIYSEDRGRIGITWGADASWADTTHTGDAAIDNALALWRFEPEEWELRN